MSSTVSATEIEHRSYARIGLLGNPSDVYNGRTISFTISNFSAVVTIKHSQDVVIMPNRAYDPDKFSSMDDLVNQVKHGFTSIDAFLDDKKENDGGVRLLMAICKVFIEYCKGEGITLPKRNFTLTYYTNIPRQTGLSGSSAIVSAGLNCLLDFYNVKKDSIKKELLPQIVLNAEKELGIVAGLQDRVAQIYRGLVYMDFSEDHMKSKGHGNYTPMDANLLPKFHLIYANNPSDSGKVHSTVRERWLNGDRLIISAMKEVENLAYEGKTAIENKDYPKLATLMDRNFDLRRVMFGDNCLGETNIKMVEIARNVGAAAKFTGSGGAVVVYCPGGLSQVEKLRAECVKSGFEFVPVNIAGSV